MTNTIKVLMHTITMGDVEDPEIYAAEPLFDWQNSEKGQWCMENAIDTPYYTISQDYTSWGYTIQIVGELMERDYTYFNLRWGNK